MLVHRTKKLLVRATSVGSDISYFHKQTEKTLIRQLLQNSVPNFESCMDSDQLAPVKQADLGQLCFLSTESLSSEMEVLEL